MMQSKLNWCHTELVTWNSFLLQSGIYHTHKIEWTALYKMNETGIEIDFISICYVLHQSELVNALMAATKTGRFLYKNRSAFHLQMMNHCWCCCAHLSIMHIICSVLTCPMFMFIHVSKIDSDLFTVFSQIYVKYWWKCGWLSIVDISCYCLLHLMHSIFYEVIFLRLFLSYHLDLKLV